MIALDHATLVIQRSWRRTLFLRERQAASTQIQTQYRRWSASRYYFSLLKASTKAQTQWRRFVNRKKYVRVHQSIVDIQTTFRRWYYGVVSVSLRRAALQKLQNAARCMLAARALEVKRQFRKDSIKKAIVCQVSRRGMNLYYCYLFSHSRSLYSLPSQVICSKKSLHG